jgi:adenosylcobinamide hydrolase
VIDGVEVAVDREAVVVRAARLLRVVSSAPVGGGLGRARAIVNLHVAKDHPCDDPAGDLARFCRTRGLASPWVGLLTAAWTDRAEVELESAEGITALAVATVGLSHLVAAGASPVARWRPSTINAVVVVDGDPSPAALVNAVATLTEAKVLALAEAGVSARGGGAASGTSTDAVVVAATGRGPALAYGGPASLMGWLVARAARAAIARGIARWRAEHP